MLNTDKIEIACAHLKGNPHWDTFMEVIEEEKEMALTDFESYQNIDSHAVLARLSGVLSLCRTILTYGR